MNILIITPFFKQDKNIASVRWTKLAPRLAKNHNVILVTQPLDDMDEHVTITEEEGFRVVRANQKSWYEKIAVKYFHGATGNDLATKSTSSDGDNTVVPKDTWKRKLKNCLIYASAKFKAKSYAKWICQNVIPKGTKIDVVISSACPFIEMLFGYEVKRLLKCKWVCEFRDLPFTVDNSDDTHIKKNIMNHVLPVSDTIISTAPSGKEYLIDNYPKICSQIHVITNGFSQDDIEKAEISQDECLHIVYTGSLYPRRYSLDTLFKAAELAQRIEPSFRFILECCGGNSFLFLDTAKKYNMTDKVHYLGLIPRKKALELQRKADCLLIYAAYCPGSLSAKIYEYMMMKKPIVCITGGNQPKSDEDFYVKNINLGCAILEANGEPEVQKLAQYFIEQYQRKIQNIPLLYNPVFSEVQKFDYNSISMVWESLIKSLRRA